MMTSTRLILGGLGVVNLKFRVYGLGFKVYGLSVMVSLLRLSVHGVQSWGFPLWVAARLHSQCPLSPAGKMIDPDPRGHSTCMDFLEDASSNGDGRPQGDYFWEDTARDSEEHGAVWGGRF